MATNIVDKLHEAAKNAETLAQDDLRRMQERLAKAGDMRRLAVVVKKHSQASTNGNAAGLSNHELDIQP